MTEDTMKECSLLRKAHHHPSTPAGHLAEEEYHHAVEATIMEEDHPPVPADFHLAEAEALPHLEVQHHLPLQPPEVYRSSP